jgi:hypothetical protein
MAAIFVALTVLLTYALLVDSGGLWQAVLVVLAGVLGYALLRWLELTLRLFADISQGVENVDANTTADVA